MFFCENLIISNLLHSMLAVKFHVDINTVDNCKNEVLTSGQFFSKTKRNFIENPIVVVCMPGLTE